MGKRGPLPKLVKESEALATLDAPEWLGDVAKAYWNLHAAWLVKHQLLNAQTAEAFAVCCDLWERYRTFDGEKTSRIYLDVVKAFEGKQKVFRLSPSEKAGYQAERHDDKEEFDF